jgi:hypothetical protein
MLDEVARKRREAQAARDELRRRAAAGDRPAAPVTPQPPTR